jgi:hypothetical protein
LQKRELLWERVGAVAIDLFPKAFEIPDKRELRPHVVAVGAKVAGD